MAELEEVVVELSLLDVEDVVLDCGELADGDAEFLEDGLDVSGHDLALGVADLDLLKLIELGDCSGQVHDVLATFSKGVQTHEERVGRDLPLVLGLALVIEVGVFESGADFETHRQLRVSFTGSSLFDQIKDLGAIDGRPALLDDSVADLSDENDEARGRVVVLRVVPDQQDRVHDRHELVGNIRQLLRGVTQVVE